MSVIIAHFSTKKTLFVYQSISIKKKFKLLFCKYLKKRNPNEQEFNGQLMIVDLKRIH